MKTLLSFLILLMATSPITAFCNDALTAELKVLATDFAKIIQKQGGGSAVVGEFSASSEVQGSVGPRLQLVLTQELKSQGINIDQENYRFEIKGDYQPLVDKETQLLGVKLIGRLIDRETGEPLAEKPTGRFVFGAETVPLMLGLNVSGKPEVNPQDLSNHSKEAKKHPEVEFQNTLLQGKSGQYAMEILVKQGNSYRAQKISAGKAGQPFVDLAPEDIYGVRLINNSPQEAAIELSIDGVNCFAFSENKARFWIVGPGEKVDVLGWHQTNEKSLEFKVVENFSHTAAAKLNLKPSAKIGLITACFSACWEESKSPPADEKNFSTRGTGFGSEIKVKTTQVKRIIGNVRDTHSVRYER